MPADFSPQFQPATKPAKPFSVLTEAGKLRRDATPDMTDAQILEALRLMKVGRAFDEKCLSLQRQGRLGTFAPIFGQEATLVGTAMAMDPKRDWAVPQYREFPVQLRQGVSMKSIILYRRGHPDGGIIPDGVNVMATQVSLAAQIPHAVGLAWGIKLKEQDGVAVVFFGDGASSEGDFHESCNLAGVVDAPVIFLLQNNQWAISTPRSIQTAGADFASRAPAYGFPGVSVDGNDLFAVYKVVKDAVERGRRGEGATLVEAVTYRMAMHTTADDPTRYVDPRDLEVWGKRDPIVRIEKYLKATGDWSDDMAAKWDQEIQDEVETAFAEADAHAPPDPAAIYEHVFAEPTPTLVRQQAAHLGSS